MDIAEMENTHTSETPHGTTKTNTRGSHGSYDGADSGYLTLTPNSGGYTSIVAACRSRTSLASSKRHYRTRTEPWQSDRRLRSKFNHRINAPERACDSMIDESHDTSRGLSRDSGNFSCENQSSSVDGSASFDSRNAIGDTRDYGVEYRERRSGGRRAGRGAVAVTPASGLQLLSPPPSPAVPSSSFVAFEPIDEDVEMKLVVVSQSTPYLNSPNRNVPPNNLNFSPTTRRTTPPSVTSVDNKKLSDLMITDLSSIADIKPKRLDFSRRALSYALHRTRATPDFTGKESVDLLSLLGEKSNHWRVVSKIFSHLNAQDLCAASMVSKAWRRICANDSRANTRRLAHIILRQNAKENLKLVGKAKTEGDIRSSPKSRYARKGYLLEVQNLLQVPATQRPPNSPPVSPSKVKFHSFVKASRSLEPWEHLLACPSCSFPCHVDDEKNVGKCSRQGCSMEFCTSCSSRPHSGPCKTPLLATPTKRSKRLIAGSRQSKRNLRRL